MTQRAADSDWNLLYGFVAVQLGFLERETMGAGLRAWSERKDRPLGEILRERGWLAPAEVEAVDAEVARLLARYADDPAGCLTLCDVDLLESLREPSVGIEDADLRASLSSLETRVSEPGAGETEAGLEATLDSQAETVASGSSASGSAGWAEGGVDPSLGPRRGASSERFRKVRLHKEGGLGVVWLAWDEEVGRYVALKEMRARYAMNERLRGRFIREAEITGNLEHPGIVPIYALGTDEEGRPFYAMRFVKGDTLQVALEGFHKTSDETNPSAETWLLGMRSLLTRFVVICDSIAYAHSRRVLHRDLKPANVMLGKHGETVMIDWGLAKLMSEVEEPAQEPGGGVSGPESGGAADAEESAVRLPHATGDTETMIGETLGSPPYMSPEQATGRHEALRPTSDIYSLGATLFAVLTGRPPVIAKTTKEILHRVTRGDLDTACAVNPRVPKPLEAICKKAMAWHPGERYPSARALADDLERWLADRPVSVYPDPVLTRVARWARQHKPHVAAGLALLVTGLIGLGISNAVVGVQKRRAEEAQRATAEALKQEAAARQLARSHLGVGLEVVDQFVAYGDGRLIAQQPLEERNALLAKALEFVRRFRENAPDDPNLQFQSALLARRLGNVRRYVGDFAAAESFYAEAIPMWETLVKNQPQTPTTRDQLAQTLLDRASGLVQLGRGGEALPLLEAALREARTNEGSRGGANEQRVVGRVLTELGGVQWQFGNPQAEQTCREAIGKLKPLADGTLERVQALVREGGLYPLLDQLFVVTAEYRLSEALEAVGKGSEAITVLRGAFERMRTLVRQFQGEQASSDVEYHHAFVGTRLGRLLSEDTGTRDEGLALIDEAVERLRGLTKGQPDVLQFRMELAGALAAQAQAALAAGNRDGARRSAEEAVARLETLRQAYPSMYELTSAEAEARAAWGQALAGGTAPDRQGGRRELERAVALGSDAARAMPSHPLFPRRLQTYQQALDQLPAGG